MSFATMARQRLGDSRTGDERNEIDEKSTKLAEQLVPHEAMFFFSSRRRHTRSLCDWSSDVCSSTSRPSPSAFDMSLTPISTRPRTRASASARDRQSVVSGKSVDLGGRRLIKTKN